MSFRGRRAASLKAEDVLRQQQERFVIDDSDGETASEEGEEGEEESESEESQKPELNAYEKERLQNIEANKKVLHEMGLGDGVVPNSRGGNKAKGKRPIKAPGPKAKRPSKGGGSTSASAGGGSSSGGGSSGISGVGGGDGNGDDDDDWSGGDNDDDDDDDDDGDDGGGEVQSAEDSDDEAGVAQTDEAVRAYWTILMGSRPPASGLLGPEDVRRAAYEIGIEINRATAEAMVEARRALLASPDCAHVCVHF
jgi:hypothetical protein